MRSLLTLPIRLPLYLTARAVRLGAGVVGALLGREDRYRPAPGVDVPAPPREADHVDREASVVYAAGPAAEPGASVHVEAPWEGYDAMRATDVVARLRGADAATRAVVRLYEQQGKARSSVLAATD